MKCCFIACDNGLGHIRRVAAVCRELERHDGIELTLFANRVDAGRVGREAEDFQTKTSTSALRDGARHSTRWHERLPSLDSFDIVVSDNLPEVLETRGDAILMGSFLWHMVLDEVDAEYKRSAENLLGRHRPVMLGSARFASEELIERTRFHDVGLFGRLTIDDRPRNSLLISCGMSGQGSDETESAIETLVREGRGRYETVFVEPRFLPYKHESWMQAADYSSAMYSSLSAALLRPGMGTLTEVLQAGAWMYCFYEAGNAELAHNAKCVETYGYGYDCGDVRRALSMAMTNQLDPPGPGRAVSDFAFNGAGAAAKYILSLENSR